SAICKLNCVAKKLTIGTPTTIPAETPMNTRATAFGAFSGLTESEATEKASEIETGWKIAGIILTINKTAKLVVNTETKLLITNITNTIIMTFLRSTLDNSNGMIGPDMAIPIANIETNQPA